MALVIFNARYISSENRQNEQQSNMRYGATREGVEKFPEGQNMSKEDYFNYIATREGSEAYEGSCDGLFNQNGKANLEEEISALEAHSDSLEWRAVFSLSKEDAHRVGLYNASDWQKVLCRVMPSISKQFNISPQSLVWNAAFHPIDKHGSDHHPHVHIYFYSKDAKEGVAGDIAHTKKAFRRCRSILTNDVFKEDMAPYKIEKTKSKENLRDLVKEFVRYAPSNLLDGVVKALPEKGKIEYGRVNKETKLEVDKVVKQICSTPGVSEAYEQLRSVVRQQAENYFKDPEDVDAEMQEWEKNFFHPEGRNKYEYRVLHNAVLYEAVKKKADSTTREIIDSIPKELKAEILKKLELSVAANEKLPAFQKAFKKLSTVERKKIIRRLTSDAVFFAGNDIYKILYNDEPLLNQLLEEVRLDVPTDWQDGECAQFNLLSKESNEAIEYYIKVITDGRVTDYNSAYKLKLRFLDIALNKKAQALVSEAGSDMSFKVLQDIFHCKNPRLEELPDAAVKECARIAAALAEKNKEIAGSVAAGQSERILRAITNEAYQREVSARVSEVYSSIDRQACLSVALSGDFKCGLSYAQLSQRLQEDIDRLASPYLCNTDEYAKERIKATICQVASGQRIKEIVISDDILKERMTAATADFRVFCNVCEIEAYSALPENKKSEFLDTMRNVFSINQELSDYIDSNSDYVGQTLFYTYKTVESINEQNRRIALLGNIQLLGMVSSAISLFTPKKQNQEQEAKRERNPKRKRQNRDDPEEKNPEENIEY